jgi:hypothetical protein
MHRIALALFSLPVLALAGSADLSSTCNTGLDTELKPGQELRMELRSGEIQIVGTDRSRLRVTCDLKQSDDARDVSISFRPAGAGGKLRIQGGPRDDARFRIEVPRQTHLHVRTTAGELKVRDIIGNKDVQLRAGELTISGDDPAEYRQTQASVRIGELSASRYGVNKGGFFRSFRSTRPNGKYNLRAHLTVGELRLQ